jgi:hypothetical protein
MLKRLVWLMFLCASANAFAAEWVALPAVPTGDLYFYDNSKLVIKDDEVTYWKKVQFKSPQSLNGSEVASGILRERINCSEHTYKLMTYLYYSPTGETVQYVPQDESVPAPIVPDTVGDNYDRALCPVVWRKQEETRIKNEQKAAEQEAKDDNKPKDSGDTKPLPQPALQRSSLKAKPLEMITTPPPKMPAATLPSKAPNVRLPDKVQQLQLPTPQQPLPDPQIMEQLY